MKRTINQGREFSTSPAFAAVNPAGHDDDQGAVADDGMMIPLRPPSEFCGVVETIIRSVNDETSMTASSADMNNNTNKNHVGVIRYPCPARGIPDHHPGNAFLEIPEDAPHGYVLKCSHPECAKSKRRVFRYCAVCRVAASKRNFTKRHVHTGEMGELMKNNGIDNSKPFMNHPPTQITRSSGSETRKRTEETMPALASTLAMNDNNETHRGDEESHDQIMNNNAEDGMLAIKIREQSYAKIPPPHPPTPYGNSASSAIRPSFRRADSGRTLSTWSTSVASSSSTVIDFGSNNNDGQSKRAKRAVHISRDEEKWLKLYRTRLDLADANGMQRWLKKVMKAATGEANQSILQGLVRRERQHQQLQQLQQQQETENQVNIREQKVRAQLLHSPHWDKNEEDARHSQGPQVDERDGSSDGSSVVSTLTNLILQQQSVDSFSLGGATVSESILSPPNSDFSCISGSNSGGDKASSDDSPSDESGDKDDSPPSDFSGRSSSLSDGQRRSSSRGGDDSLWGDSRSKNEDPCNNSSNRMRHLAGQGRGNTTKRSAQDTDLSSPTEESSFPSTGGSSRGAGASTDSSSSRTVSNNSSSNSETASSDFPTTGSSSGDNRERPEDAADSTSDDSVTHRNKGRRR